MDKQLKDYLHYYIGHVDYRVKYIDGDSWTIWSKLTPGRYARAVEDHSVEKIEIGVRKLESMSEVDLIGWLDILSKIMGQQYDDATMRGEMLEALELIREHGLAAFSFDDDEILQAPHLFHYLLSRGFDLWNLIDAGLAVDKATIKS